MSVAAVQEPTPKFASIRNRRESPPSREVPVRTGHCASSFKAAIAADASQSVSRWMTKLGRARFAFAHIKGRKEGRHRLDACRLVESLGQAQMGCGQ
jgi:hypothetical protein